MRVARPLVALGFLLAALLGMPAHADVGDSEQSAPGVQTQTTVNIQASKDNTLVESGSGGVSNGAGTSIFVGRVGTNPPGNPIRRGTVAFEIAGNVPAGATVDSVTLTLNLSRLKTATLRTVSLHKVLADWGEGTSSSGGGKGVTATTNDATWLHRFFSGSTWTSVGGDYSGGASGSQSVGGFGAYSWTSAQMASDVQGWLDNSSTNFGWIIIGDEVTSKSIKWFHSREATNAANRPVLSVTYTVAANAAPVANDDGYTVVPGTILSVTTSAGVLANDSDADGDNLTAVLVEDVPGGEGTLTLSADGSFTYDPGASVITTSFTYRAQDPFSAQSNLATVTLKHPSLLQVTVAPTTVDEDSSTVNATITLTNASTTPSTSTFTTVDGTAGAGTDYTPVSQTVSLDANTTSTQIAITVLNDAGDPVREGQEQFSVKLSDPSSGTIISGDAGSGVSFTVTIDDQQDIPFFVVAGPFTVEGAASTTAAVPVSLVGKSLLTSMVTFTTRNTTTAPFAKEGEDYVFASTTLVFPPNTTTASSTQTVPVTLIGDNIDEFDEVFEVALLDGQEPSTGLPVSLGTASSLATILDDDPAPGLAMNNQTVDENASTTTFDVTLIGASIAGISVDLSIVGGTATGTDYQFAPATLTWAPGESGVRTTTVTLLDDSLLEGPEIILFSLTNETTTGTSPEGVIVQTRSADLKIIDDEAPLAIPAATPLALTIAAVLFAAAVFSRLGLRRRRSREDALA